MADHKHPDDFDDEMANALMQMAQDGLVVIDGDKVTLTEKGREWLENGNGFRKKPS